MPLCSKVISSFCDPQYFTKELTMHAWKSICYTIRPPSPWDLRSFKVPGLIGTMTTLPSRAVQKMLFPRLEFWKFQALKNSSLPELWQVLHLQQIQAAVISQHAQGRSLEILEAWPWGATASWGHTWQCSAWGFHCLLMDNKLYGLTGVS